MSVWRWSEMKAQAIGIPFHPVSLIIGCYFTANISILLLLSHMAIWLIAVSSVSHSLSYLWRPSRYQNWPPQTDFPKGFQTACFKIEMQRWCFYMKRTEHLQKSFDVIFIVIPDKVEFERSVYLITAIRRFHAAAILKSKARLRWEETRK